MASWQWAGVPLGRLKTWPTADQRASVVCPFRSLARFARFVILVQVSITCMPCPLPVLSYAGFAQRAE